MEKEARHVQRLKKRARELFVADLLDQQPTESWLYSEYFQWNPRALLDTHDPGHVLAVLVRCRPVQPCTLLWFGARLRECSGWGLEFTWTPKYIILPTLGGLGSVVTW